MYLFFHDDLEGGRGRPMKCLPLVLSCVLLQQFWFCFKVCFHCIAMSIVGPSWRVGNAHLASCSSHMHLAFTFEREVSLSSIIQIDLINPIPFLTVFLGRKLRPYAVCSLRHLCGGNQCEGGCPIWNWLWLILLVSESMPSFTGVSPWCSTFIFSTEKKELSYRWHALLAFLSPDSKSTCIIRSHLLLYFCLHTSPNSVPCQLLLLCNNFLFRMSFHICINMKLRLQYNISMLFSIVL